MASDPELGYHMHVWHDPLRFLAVANARSIEEARKLVLATDLGDSGDGSCPEHDLARKAILEMHPTIWHRGNAEFALKDSAELREQEEYSRVKSAEAERLRGLLRGALEKIEPFERKWLSTHSRAMTASTLGEQRFAELAEVAAKIREALK